MKKRSEDGHYLLNKLVSEKKSLRWTYDIDENESDARPDHELDKSSADERIVDSVRFAEHLGRLVK